MRREAVTASDRDVKDFEQEAKSSRTNLFSEFWSFLKHNKKWWLAPILIVLLLVTVLVILSGTAAAPFIYTLF